MMLKPGDVLFTRRKRALISRVFAWVMRSRFSHASIVVGVDSETLDTYLIEASKFEVSMGPTSKYTGGTHDLVVLRPTRLSAKSMKNIISGAMDMYGQPYGYLQVVSMGLRRMLMRLGLRIPNVLRQGVVCCGVVMYGYTKSNIPFLGGSDVESFDVQEVFEAMCASKWLDGEMVFQAIEGENNA